MRLVGGERGDTIIEVLFAVTVFSLIAVGGLSLMNQGTAIAQRALEIGLVRQQMDAQADALRQLSSAYVGDYGRNGVATTEWKQIVEDNAVSQAVAFDTIAGANGCVNPATINKAFAIDVEQLDITQPDAKPLIRFPTNQTQSYAQIVHDGTAARAEGIWIQAVRSTNGTNPTNPGYYDFHIRACWDSPGQTVPVTLGTIVRLYEPRG